MRKVSEGKPIGIKFAAGNVEADLEVALYADPDFITIDGRPFPMVSDGAGKIGSVYGVYDEGSGVDVRGRFIIDPDRVIQAIEILIPSVGRNVSELLRQIQAFQLVRKTKGSEATPSGWQPGRPTLKPGPDLVGKVWEVWKTDLAF